MIQTNKILNKTLNAIIKSRSQKKAVIEFSDFINKHGWPVAINNSEVIKALKLIISEKLPHDPSGDLVNTLMNIERKVIKLTNYQKRMLEEVITHIDSSDRNTCNHKNIGISTFMHGGGFCMTTNLPEIICLDCGLNVTLRNYKENISFETEYGISIQPDDVRKLFVWANKQQVYSADIINKDPIGAYNKSANWPGTLPFTIIDAKVLENKSGL